MAFGALAFRSYVDWQARSDSGDSQGGYARTFAAAVRLRGIFAPDMPSHDALADQTGSRARGTVLLDPRSGAVHEGDRLTTPDGRVWEVLAVAPYRSPAMPIATNHAMLAQVVESQGT